MFHGDVPIIAVIGLLDNKKGVDLIGEAMPWIAYEDVMQELGVDWFPVRLADHITACANIV
jgi:hypothetical protein